MTVNDLKQIPEFTFLNEANPGLKITKPFCCDLLSIAMSKAPAGSAWVTIMGNVNALAVATLCECACIIIAEGVIPEAAVVPKAVQQYINVIKTDLPIFEAAQKINELLNAST